MQLSQKGFKFIINFEDLKLESYLDPAGIPTIGYGTTKLNGHPVTLGMTINQPVADALFYGHIDGLIKDIGISLYPSVKLNQNQIDAIISFTYNCGIGALGQSSLLRNINIGKKVTEELFIMWNKAHVKGVLVPISGLTTRRQKEFALFSEAV